MTLRTAMNSFELYRFGEKEEQQNWFQIVSGQIVHDK